MGIENRRHERIDIAIEVRVSGTDTGGQPIEESTLSGDISLSGCSVLLSQELAGGVELDLKFLHRTPGVEEPRVLELHASVVRSIPMNQEQYIVGMQFLNGTFPMEILK